METRVRRSQAERSAETTDELLASARRLFAERGYASTSLSDIVAEAGLTKGAVYHHFTGKQEVFRAVFEREHRALAATVADAAQREADPWVRVRVGWHAFMAAAEDPAVQRIVLLEAPGALGWDATREIAGKYALSLLETGLAAAMEAKRIAARPVGPFARLLYAAMCEAATITASAPVDQKTSGAVLAAVDALLDGLEMAPGSS